MRGVLYGGATVWAEDAVVDALLNYAAEAARQGRREVLRVPVQVDGADGWLGVLLTPHISIGVLQTAAAPTGSVRGSRAFLAEVGARTSSLNEDPILFGDPEVDGALSTNED